MDIRTEAKTVAKSLIEDDATTTPVSIDRYAEMLDAYRRIVEVKGTDYTDLEIVREETPAFYHLAYSTVAGAVRAAARELGCYDADTDEVTPR